MCQMGIITNDESKMLIVEENKADFIVSCNLLPI